MNTYPFNKTPFAKNIDFLITPYTTKVEKIKPKPLEIIDLDVIDLNTRKKPSKIKYIFIILFICLVIYIYQNYTELLPKIIQTLPNSLVNKIPLSYKNKLQNTLINMRHTQNFEYKPFYSTNIEQHQQQNIDDKIYFNDYFLDYEIRKLLDIEEDIIITKTQLDSIKGVLSLRDKRIEHILGMENIENINGIDLSTNNIEYIPYVSKNTYAFMNKNIGIFYNMKDLQYINLASNRLINIDYIYKDNLTRLDLSDNKIVSIKVIGKLHNLEYLNIANNNIIDMYPLTKLKKLNFLNISYNHINKSPKMKYYYDRIKTKNKQLGKFLYKPFKEIN